MKTGFSIPSAPLFGLKTRRTLRYYTVASVSSGASAAGAYVFSANGIFDPDISGTGGQPMGFDQMMVFFNHYTVVRSRIRLVAQSNSSTLRVSAGLSVSGSSTVTTSIEQLVENGNLTFNVLEYAGTMGGACTLHRSVVAARFQGIDDVMDDPNMRGDAASNPAEQMYYHISCWNAASATTVTIDCQVYIEYDVVFTEPRKGTISVANPAPSSTEEKRCPGRDQAYPLTQETRVHDRVSRVHSSLESKRAPDLAVSINPTTCDDIVVVTQACKCLGM